MKKRIKQAYDSAKKSIKKSETSIGFTKKDYLYGFIWTSLLLIIGFFLNNTFGNILIIIAIFISPFVIWLQGFWMFVICLIKPE
ncbi:MAG: hypothetical protein A2431_00510 [Candidatus Zambryskibacteria bacterium RIFOXYC1_FULL_39_10]|uniref:Uncharacterized protein n=1 Tax=Candidatus Zambryskibacteria bacterium RIFOXYC1_FULL_39_10 TaxID=1802779 RepID=A0A1G2UZ77_9BACT|nr:MAG: hypothetical protein A2431_00510 [Candidatus Zambryskibacteria bacterium RIFOXYC1_FULL_39_10]OHB15627.1 MAG: hypothetical protein A2605_02370 [Candidatus Zambryskibacteria bacterium RIFOXYD1_FULL_39_35]